MLSEVICEKHYQTTLVGYSLDLSSNLTQTENDMGIGVACLVSVCWERGKRRKWLFGTPEVCVTQVEISYAEASQYAINTHFCMSISKSKEGICARPKLHWFWTNHLPAFHPYQSDPRIIKSQNKMEQLKSAEHWSWGIYTDSGNTAGFRRQLTMSEVKCNTLKIL